MSPFKAAGSLREPWSQPNVFHAGLTLQSRSQYDQVPTARGGVDNKMHSSQQQSSILSSAKPATTKWVCKTRRKCTTFLTVLQPLPEAICQLTISHSLAVLCHAHSLRARVHNAESAGPDLRLSVALQHVNCRLAPVPVWRTLRQDADHIRYHSLLDKPCMHYLHDRVTACTCVATSDGWLSIICVSYCEQVIMTSNGIAQLLAPLSTCATAAQAFATLCSLPVCIFSSSCCAHTYYCIMCTAEITQITCTKRTSKHSFCYQIYSQYIRTSTSHATFRAKAHSSGPPLAHLNTQTYLLKTVCKAREDR